MQQSELPEEIHHELLQYARSHWVPCMSGATESRMIQHLMTWKPLTMVEVGAAVGRSTLRFADTLVPRNGHVFSCEISHPRYMIGIYHQRRSGHTNMTMYNTSALTLPREDILPESIDCVFIDAAKHEYHTYLERLLPLCSAHAHIICDDVGDYADKVAPIYNSLRHHGLHRTTHALADGDTILHIHLTPDLH